MSAFVEQCRREWQRLGVPDPLAEEMAADLAADLGEAEAEGVSAEEFLGNSVFDPRAFASSWAAERGLIPAPADTRGIRRHRPLVLVAFTALAAIGVIVAALLLATGEPKVAIGQPKVSIVGTFVGTPPPHLRLPSSPGRSLVPAGASGQVSASASAPVEWILLFLAIAALGFAAWLWSRWGRSRPAAAA